VRIRNTLLSIAGVGALVLACNRPPEVMKRESAGKLVLEGVTVVDTRSGALTPDVSVVMSNGTIIAIERADSVAPDVSARVVDARGKFVVPGYLDMHAHALGPEDPSGTLALMLSWGVTGFRQMQGSSELIEQRRTGTLPIGRDAPALLVMPGAILTPPNAGSPEDVVKTITEQKTAGADFIKVAFTSGTVLAAAMAETKRRDIPIAGHVPRDMSVTAAAEGGIRAIEHLGPGDGMLIACSSDEAALRAAIASHPVATDPPFRLPFKLPFFDQIMTATMRRQVANPVLTEEARDVARMQRAVDTYDEQKCRQVAALFVAHQTWQAPTLIRLRTTQLCDSPEYASDPNLRFVSASTIELWQDVKEDFVDKQPPEARATLRALYARQLQLTKLLDDAGVRMLAGSDVSGVWLVPGASLHQEFDELEKAGIPPLHVLQMTTLNGAEFLDRTATMGTVERGKDADLVLLDANPLDTVQNLHAIHAVVRAGQYYGSDDLEALRVGVQNRGGAAP
jgi:hypothetical protein